MVSLSISDGGSADSAFDSKIPLVDFSLWFPSPPGPNLIIHGMDSRDRWHFDPLVPITMTMFDTPSQDLDKISSLAVRTEGENMFGLEVCYPPGTIPVRLGLDGVRTGEISSFPIDYANGEA